MSTCAVDGCDNPTRARGWCETHYQRWRRHGDPLTVVKPQPPTEIQHGTYSGWQRCKNRPGGCCEECRPAQAAYQRKRRQSSAEVRLREYQAGAARQRALRRLAAVHSREYRALLTEEMARDEQTQGRAA